MSGPGGPVSSVGAATEGLQAVGAAGPAGLPAGDHADLPYPVPEPGRPVGSEAVLTVGEVVRSLAGAASLADRRAKLIPAGALPGGACRARLDGRLVVDLLRRGDAAPAI